MAAFLVVSFFLTLTFIRGIPINDTSILQNIVLVTENTLDSTVLKYPYIIMLYYDIRDEISSNFYHNFIKLRSQVSQIHPEMKIGVFEMAPSLNTAEKLRINKHPHVKLFIHGIENEHFSHYHRPFQNIEEIFNWAKAEIHRLSQNPTHHLHHEIRLPHLKNSVNMTAILQSSTSKVIYCNQVPDILELEKKTGLYIHNMTEIMQKFKHALSREDVKFYLADHDFELCKNQTGKLIIFGSHEKHAPHIINPHKTNIREISKIIKKNVHPHVLSSKSLDFVDKLWKTHKPLALVFIKGEAKHEALMNYLNNLTENPIYVKEIQFAIVDGETSNGKIIFEKARVSSDSNPIMMITHNMGHKSKKYRVEIKEQDFSRIEDFLQKYLRNEHHEHRHTRTKKPIFHEYHPFIRFPKYRHLSSEEFNQTIETEAPILVFFYWKKANFTDLMSLYEEIFAHVKEEYEFTLNLATLDVFDNEIDNVGYYNIDHMPAVFLYLSPTEFIDLTDFTHNHDIKNILYSLEKIMNKNIKYHSVKFIKTAVESRRKAEGEKVLYQVNNIKNEL